LRVAEVKGYEIVRTFEVSDVSGTSTAAAPEMKRLLGMIEFGEVDVVMVSEMSRLVRPDDLTSLAILDTFKRANVLIDVGGSVVDFASPEGFLTGGIQAILGGHERMQMLRKMMESKEERRRMGKCPGSRITLPLGISYNRERDEWGLNDSEIWRIQEAFRIIDEEGVINVCEVARRVGINAQALRKQLKNPIYKGIRLIDTKRDLSVKHTKADGRQGDRPKIKRAPDEIISVRVYSAERAAVSEERWERVNEVLQKVSMVHKLDLEKNARAHLLTGVARCGYCGERMYTKKESAKSGNFGHMICKTKHEAFRKKMTPCKQPWLRIESLESLTLAFAR
jgi:site-specific DNA recombinase